MLAALYREGFSSGGLPVSLAFLASSLLDSLGLVREAMAMWQREGRLSLSLFLSVRAVAALWSSSEF